MSRANFVQVKLASDATAAATSLTIEAVGPAFNLPPTDGGVLTLTDSMGSPQAFEIVTYTARSGTGPTYTLSGVVRGKEGTTARAWSKGHFVFQSLTALDFAAELAAKLDVADPWAAQPIGSPIAVWDHITGVNGPPTNKSYRYIKLSAADAYNTGVLTSESVSGTDPEVVASAVVSLAGSPLNGRTIRLINTERRFLRPGESGVNQASLYGAHDHTTSTTSDAHSHSFSTTTGSAGAHKHAANPEIVTTVGGIGLQAGTQRYYNANYLRDTSAGGAHTHSVSGTTGSDSHSHTVTVNNSGGSETRPRNIGATYYMRIL
jgi:hypothetical protein